MNWKLPGNHLQSSGGILHPLERPGGNQVREDLGDDHHPEEEHQSVGDLESALRHNEVLLFTPASIPLPERARDRRWLPVAVRLRSSPPGPVLTNASLYAWPFCEAL